MLWFIVWVICGFTCSVIAGYKGRSAGGWFVAGIFLGPLAIIIIAVMPENKLAVEKMELSSGNTKKCPMCAELVKFEAIKCKHCGSELSVS